MVEDGDAKLDDAQQVVVDWLDKYTTYLYANLHGFQKYKAEYDGIKGGKGAQTSARAFQKLQYHFEDLDDIKSIYLWGDPGCGKSFIAELFFEGLKKDMGASVKFLHYQESMLQIHEKEHRVNKKLRGKQ